VTAAEKLVGDMLPTDVPLEAASRLAWHTLTGETVAMSGRVVPTRRLLRSSIALGRATVSVVLPDTVANRIAVDLLDVRSDAAFLNTMTLDFVGEFANLVAGIIGDELAERGIDAPRAFRSRACSAGICASWTSG
jgi:hypothetical protein